VFRPVLVRKLPGLVRRWPVLPGQAQIRMNQEKEMTTPEDPEETQEFDPFTDDEDQDDDPVPVPAEVAILP
jgi:hypothetical protein